LANSTLLRAVQQVGGTEMIGSPIRL